MKGMFKSGDRQSGFAVSGLIMMEENNSGNKQCLQ
jgi:hypothetical protein